MPNIRKSQSHAAANANAEKADPVGFEQRREEFVQRMVTEGLAKLEDKLKTRKGKRVFRDEVKFQKGLHKEACALRSVVATKHRHELMLLETAVKAARTLQWKGFVEAARPLRRKLGGRALQVMWWAMNTSERKAIQITDLQKWVKGKSRLNNELAIRLRAKLAMFSDLIHQIRTKARHVYRDGDPRFKTYCLEALMLDYSAMEDQSSKDQAEEEAEKARSKKSAARPRSHSLPDLDIAGSGNEDDDSILTATVQLKGAGLSHTYKQLLNKKQQSAWKLQHARTADMHVGENLTVQIGARSFLATVPDVPLGGMFDITIPDWMRGYLADQEESDFMASCRAARHASPLRGVDGDRKQLLIDIASPRSAARKGYTVKKAGFTDSMLDVILMEEENATASAACAVASTESTTRRYPPQNRGDTKEGELKKQGATLGLWHTRYFRLHVHFLTYWKSKAAYQRAQVDTPAKSASAENSAEGSEVVAAVNTKIKRKHSNKKDKLKTAEEVLGRGLDNANSPFSGNSFYAQPDKLEPGCEHATVSDLQATYAATVTPEACFDLHLLQSAVVERTDIVLTFTTTCNASVVRRLRAASHASALSWQEAIYQHYTWYCTSKETELLAFMDMAQAATQAKRTRDSEAAAVVNRTTTDLETAEDDEGICPTSEISTATKSRRVIRRTKTGTDQGLLDRVAPIRIANTAAAAAAAAKNKIADTPRTYSRRMKATLTSHEEAEARRRRKRDELLAEIESTGGETGKRSSQRVHRARSRSRVGVRSRNNSNDSNASASTAAIADDADVVGLEAPDTPPPSFGASGFGSPCEEGVSPSARKARPKSTSLFRLALSGASAALPPPPCDFGALESDEEEQQDQNKSSNFFLRRSPPPHLREPGPHKTTPRPTRALRFKAGAAGVGMAQRAGSPKRGRALLSGGSRIADGSMSPHKRVLAGARRPGWAQVPPPPPAASPKGRAPMSPLPQRGLEKQPRFRSNSPVNEVNELAKTSPPRFEEGAENELPVPAPTTEVDALPVVPQRRSRSQSRPRPPSTRRPPSKPHPKHSSPNAVPSTCADKSPASVCDGATDLNLARKARRSQHRQRRSVRVVF
eukprot:INCI13560.1.p1 GENE.INCI13560.1~~INCI13560.1.p1  ORF type:complete len:1097 (-),score=219.42 INCI13560.1:71-3361(-)